MLYMSNLRMRGLRTTDAEHAAQVACAEAIDRSWSYWARQKLREAAERESPARKTAAEERPVGVALERAGECSARTPKGAFCKECGEVHG